MRQRTLALILAVGLIAVAQVPSRSQGLLQNQLEGLVERTVGDVKFWTPPNFVIERANPADRTDSYVAMTFDSQGRLVVSKEQDFPRLLIDSNGDGVFDTEKVLTERMRNCQGLWFDGPTLYGVCSLVPAELPAGGKAPSVSGLFRATDTNGDDVLDTFDRVAAITGSMGEHGPHAIRRSPSGGFMVMLGNFSVFTDEYLDQSSPVLSYPAAQFLPHIPNWSNSTRMGAHSALYEWKPAQNQFMAFSGGNRNTYDFAYNLAGEAFAFDSDMEWDIGMPWYRDVRTVHQVLHGDYGYRDASGKLPAWSIDSLPPVRDLGRGSPVGVETYQSYAFPAEYFDNLLEADWSRGRILYTALKRAGATYTARPDPAEIVHGEPLNVTDLEVGSDGMLYFTTGGRNTRGGVWRLRYTGAAPARPDMSGILAVVRQAQPLSSWGWAAIERVKTSMGAAAFGSALEQLARNTGANAADRARAIYELQRHGPAPSAALLAAMATDSNADVRAAAIFVAGYQDAAAVRTTAAAALKDADPMVRRRAAEALMRLGQSPDRPSLAPVDDIYALLADNDRFARWAGRLLLEHTPRVEWQARVLTDNNHVSAPEGMVAWVRTAPDFVDLQPLVERQLTLLAQPKWSVDNTLRLYRAFMLTTTYLPASGLTADQRVRLHAAVNPRFPSNDERLNRDAALMLAYAGQPETISKILAAMPEGDSNQAMTLHYLYALRVIKNGWTNTQKEQLAEVLGRTSRWRGGAQFANFLSAYFEQFDPLYTTPEEKQALYARAPDFAPLSDAELEAMTAGRGGRGGAPAAGAGRGGRGAPPPPIQVRTQGRVFDKGEIFDEVIYTPRTQQPDVAAGRAIFETSCASCHRAGGIGNNHGVAALDLTASARTTARRDLLESIMFPSRQIHPNLRSTVVTPNTGEAVTGLVVRETAQAITVLRSNGTTVDVAKPVRSQTREQSTIMLDALTDSMSQAQLTNLLEFLQGN